MLPLCWCNSEFFLWTDKNFEVPISVGTFSFLAPSIRSELFYTDIEGRCADSGEQPGAARSVRAFVNACVFKESQPVAAGWGFLLTKETEIMTVETQVGETLVRSRLISLWHHIWPAAGLGVAVIATVAWSGFLGYQLFRLTF